MSLRPVFTDRGSYVNVVELESLMLHAKFHDHRTYGSGEEDF